MDEQSVSGAIRDELWQRGWRGLVGVLLLIAVPMLLGCAAAGPATDAVFTGGVGPGTRLVARLDSAGLRVDFDGDGAADAIAVGAVPANAAARVKSGAFGYGPGPQGGPCLLLVLTAGPAEALCGASPILALSTEQSPGDLPGTVQALPRNQGKARLPAFIAGDLRGDALMLDTQAGESVLFLTGSGFRWVELPGGE